MTTWVPDLLRGVRSGPADSACPHEAATIEAARTGRPTADVEAHLAACEACRGLHDDVAALAGLARRTEALSERRRLPAPGQLWWKAQLARRLEAEARVVAPLDMIERVEAVIGVAAMVVLLVALVRSVGGGPALSAPGTLWPALAELASGHQLPLTAFGLILAGTAMVLLIHHLLLED